MARVSCEPFRTPETGKGYAIINPITSQEHIFTVREYEEREMDPSRFQDESMEWPTKYAVMTYTLFPEIKDFYLQDRNRGDSPRPKKTNSHGPMASSIGIIGLRPKLDDSGEYYHPDGSVSELKITTSAMYFERPETIEWRLTLQEKRIPDISVKLI